QGLADRTGRRLNLGSPAYLARSCTARKKVSPRAPEWQTLLFVSNSCGRVGSFQSSERYADSARSSNRKNSESIELSNPRRDPCSLEGFAVKLPQLAGIRGRSAPKLLHRKRRLQKAKLIGRAPGFRFPS